MENGNNSELRVCAFCGRTENEVNFLIPARDGKTYICDACIELCADFIEENLEAAREEDAEELTFETLPRPKEIKEMLDLHVIGQEEAKLAHEEKRKTDRSLKKFRYSDFRVDPDAHHFYVPEELKYTAEIKFDSKGTSTGMLIFLLILLLVAMIVCLIALPGLMEALDRFVGGIKSATSETNGIV